MCGRDRSSVRAPQVITVLMSAPSPVRGRTSVGQCSVAAPPMGLTVASASPASGGVPRSSPDQSSRRARHIARHNLIDLRRINRLVLHQRISHQIKLVAVVFEQVMRLRVALINDAAHLRSIAKRRLVRHRLRRLPCTPAKEDFFASLVIKQAGPLPQTIPTWSPYCEPLQ